MKKLFAILAAAVIFMTVAIPAFADMDSPMFTAYEAYVVKEGGTPLYRFDWDYETDITTVEETDTVIPKGEKVTVTGEYLCNGAYYGNVDYNDKYGYVLLTDVSNEQPKYGSENAHKLEEPETVVVINPDGVYLRSGPSMTYDVVSKKIEFGTVLTYELVNDDYFHSWAYITYNGESGWLYTVQYGFDNVYNCASLVSETKGDDYYATGKVMTIDDGLQLTETPDESSKKISDKIPAGTALTYEWFFEFAKSVAVYTEYNGVKGWLIADEAWDTTAAIETDREAIVISSEEKTYLYDSPNGKKTDNYVLNGDILQYSYIATKPDYETEDDFSFTDWYMVTANGKTGWISSADDGVLISYIDVHPEGTAYLFEEMPVYSEAGKTTDKPVFYVPADAEVLCIKSFEIYDYDNDNDNDNVTKDESWYYIDFNGKTGWICDDRLIDSYADNRLSADIYDWKEIRYVTWANIHESYSRASGIVGQISEDTAVRKIYSYSVGMEDGNYDDGFGYEYIEYNGIKGWVDKNSIHDEYGYARILEEREEYSALSEEEFDVKFREQINKLNEELTEPETTEPESTETHKPEENTASPKTLIIGCVAGGAVLALTAFVVILLINKKKKSA